MSGRADVSGALPAVVTAREPSCPPPVVTRWPTLACVPGSLSTFHAGTLGADGHKRCVRAVLSVFACVELSSVENLLLH